MRSLSLVILCLLCPVLVAVDLPGVITQQKGRLTVKQLGGQAQQVFKTMFDVGAGGFVLPDPWQAAGEAFPEATSPTAGKRITAAVLEYHAARAELDPALFRVGEVQPPAPRRDPAAIINEPDLRWAHAFALDWSAPRTSRVNRPMMGLRHALDNKTALIYPDARLQIHRTVEPENDMRTLAPGGDPLSWTARIDGDDIYSGADDDADRTNAFAGGSRDGDIWLR